MGPGWQAEKGAGEADANTEQGDEGSEHQEAGANAD
jgi:hypothetical protein